MKYILSSNIGLRSWHLVPFAYYVKGKRNAKGLKKDEYELMKLCDGTHDIEDSELLRSLVYRDLIRPAKEGEVLSSWQRELICDNRYFPAMNWMITGKCNYNCLHCFNAADNNRLQKEFSLEEAEKLVDEAIKLVSDKARIASLETEVKKLAYHDSAEIIAKEVIRMACEKTK